VPGAQAPVNTIADATTADSRTRRCFTVVLPGAAGSPRRVGLVAEEVITDGPQIPEAASGGRRFAH
jgi:hypothetical protein